MAQVPRETHAEKGHTRNLLGIRVWRRDDDGYPRDDGAPNVTMLADRVTGFCGPVPENACGAGPTGTAPFINRLDQAYFGG